jgi:phenylalanyl-tRNA synthetase beta chain
MDDQVLALPPATPVTLRVARAAKVIGMPVTQAQCADVFQRLGLPSPRAMARSPSRRRAGASTCDRGRPDRGSGARHRLRQAAVHAAAGARHARCGVKRSAAPMRCAMRGRAGLPGRPSTSALSRRAGKPSWPATPTPSGAEPHRRAAGGDALQPDRQPGQRAAPQPVAQGDRGCGCSSWAACSCATSGGSGRPARGRHRQPMRVAGLAYGPAEPQWGSSERAVDFFDVKGDVEALLAPRKPVFVAAEHPALHPGRCAQVWWTACHRPCG